MIKFYLAHCMWFNKKKKYYTTKYLQKHSALFDQLDLVTYEEVEIIFFIRFFFTFIYFLQLSPFRFNLNRKFLNLKSVFLFLISLGCTISNVQA